MLNFSISEVAYRAFTTKQAQSIVTASTLDFKDALANVKVENPANKQTESSYDKYNKKKDDKQVDKKDVVKKNDKDETAPEKVDKPDKADKSDSANQTDKSQDNQKSEKADNTEKTDESQNTGNVTETEEVAETKEEVEVTEIEVFAMIAQSLQITPEQLTAVMDKLNITLEDMVNNPELLEDLISEVHTLSDIMTNKDLMDGIVKLRDMFNHKDIRVRDDTQASHIINQTDELVTEDVLTTADDLAPLRDFKNNKQMVDQTPVQENATANGEKSITQKAIADVTKEVASQAPRQEAKLEQNITQQGATTATTNQTSTTNHTTATIAPTAAQNTLTATAVGAAAETTANNNQQGSNHNNLMNMNINIEAMASKLRSTPQATNLHNLNNAPPTPRLQTPIATQIVDKIQVLTLTDGTQITVDLDPRDLGRLSLTVTENSGILKADIKVESEKVREMVLDQLDSLKETLEQKGVTISEFSVDVRDQGFHSQMEQGKSKSQRRIQELLSMHFDDDEEDEEDLGLASDEVQLEPTQIRHNQNVNIQV